MNMDFALWTSQLSGKRRIIIAERNFKGSISHTAGFFFLSFFFFFFNIRALNIINKRGAVGIVAGSGCVMSNRYLVRFGFHKWKIQADLINVQEGCMTWGLYRSHNTKQVRSAASMNPDENRHLAGASLTHSNWLNKPDKSISRGPLWSLWIFEVGRRTCFWTAQ